jgi:hypothetical protein
MIYLASPYSHPDRAVREERFRGACRATAALLRSGHAVFSPIAHAIRSWSKVCRPIGHFGNRTTASIWTGAMRSWF